MPGIKAFLTDLDGTLCGTLEANVAAYRAAFEDAGVPFNEDLYRQNFGLDFKSMMLKIASDHEDAWDMIAEQKQGHYKANAALFTPNEALLAILRDAKMNGKKIGLASTAKRKNAEAVLSAIGAADLFDATIFAEDVSEKKPNPECYTKLIEVLGVTPSEVIVFEDTDMGVVAGKKSGASVLKVSV